MSLDLRALVAQIVAERLPVSTVPARVLSVDKAAATCDVQPVEADTPEMFDVRLRAVDDGTAAGFIAWPVVGSVVLVSLIDNDLNTAFVSLASQVESFTLSTDRESLLPFLQDLFAALKAQTYSNGGGLTTPPNNLAAFAALEQRLPNLFSA
jgi:hypothetical protein